MPLRTKNAQREKACQDSKRFSRWASFAERGSANRGISREMGMGRAKALVETLVGEPVGPSIQEGDKPHNQNLRYNYKYRLYMTCSHRFYCETTSNFHNR